MKRRVYEAACGVVSHGSKILVLRRSHLGQVRLPKGRIEPGESPEEAALREVAEESGYLDLAILADLGRRVIEMDEVTSAGGLAPVRRTEHYFAMSTGSLVEHPRSGANNLFHPIWVESPEAMSILTYQFERDWVERAVKALSGRAMATEPSRVDSDRAGD